MQINRFTDLGLRVLMYLTVEARSKPVTVTEIAESFGVSRNHLVKVVHRLGKLQWLTTTRGKGGGLALARPAATYRLGDVVRELEGRSTLIDCSSPPCALWQGCHVKSALDEALDAFYDKLNHYTLADVVAPPTGGAIVQLHRIVVGVEPAGP